MQIISNVVPKDKKKIVSQKCVFVCQIDDTLVTIEINKQFNALVKDSKSYHKYRQSILINFNNFASR